MPQNTAINMYSVTEIKHYDYGNYIDVENFSFNVLVTQFFECPKG